MNGLVEQRFWRQVSPEPNSGCWLWEGSPTKGYGTLRVQGRKRMYATHVSLILDGRPRPSHSAVACHRCDMPACVNPDHLYWGSQAENLRDMTVRKRHWASKMTHCKRGHEFTLENTRIESNGGRRCRACDLNWPIGRRHRKRIGNKWVSTLSMDISV